LIKRLSGVLVIAIRRFFGVTAGTALLVSVRSGSGCAHFWISTGWRDEHILGCLKLLGNMPNEFNFTLLFGGNAHEFLLSFERN
jgi:hypothetical protein